MEIFTEVQYLIYEGKYNAVNQLLIEKRFFDNPQGLAFRAKIAELNGLFEKGLNLSIQGFSEANSIEDKIINLIMQVYCLWRLNQFNEGHLTIKRINELLNEVNLKQTQLKLIADTQNIEGLLFWKENQYNKASDLFMKSCKLRKKLHLTIPMSYSLNNLGNTYLKQMRFSEALLCYTKAKNIRTEFNNIPGIASSHNSFGRLFDAQKKYDLGLQEHLKCRELWHEIGSKQFEAKAVRFIALNYIGQKKNKLACELFEEALSMFQEIGNLTDENLTKNLIESMTL